MRYVKLIVALVGGALLLGGAAITFAPAPEPPAEICTVDPPMLRLFV